MDVSWLNEDWMGDITTCFLPVQNVRKAFQVQGMIKCKRLRRTFTKQQVNYLEKEFRKNRYIDKARCRDVSSILDIPERSVKIWFQNRRRNENKNKDLSTSLSDSDKSMELVQSPNDVGKVCVNHNALDGSLSVLKVSESPRSEEIEVNETSELKYLRVDYFKDLPPRKIDIPTATEPVPSAYKTKADVSYNLLKKCNIKKNDDVVREKITTDYQMTHTSHVNPLQYSGDHQNMNYSFYALPSCTMMPQDLSFKSEAQGQKAKSVQIRPESSYSRIDGPLNLKKRYVPPYIPPANTIWKPLKVTPFAASTPTPSLPISNPAQTAFDTYMKHDNNCTCHFGQEPTPVVQNYPYPNMQYVMCCSFSNT